MYRVSICVGVGVFGGRQAFFGLLTGRQASGQVLVGLLTGRQTFFGLLAWSASVFWPFDWSASIWSGASRPFDWSADVFRPFGLVGGGSNEATAEVFSSAGFAIEGACSLIFATLTT
jgi:hypothetical protein